MHEIIELMDAEAYSRPSPMEYEMAYQSRIASEINRRLLEVARVSHNSGLSGDSIQRVAHRPLPKTVRRRRRWKFGQPRVMALFLALIDAFHNRDPRGLVADLLGVTAEPYTASQMTYDLRRLRLKGLIFRPPRTNRYFVTPYGWKVAAILTTGRSDLQACHGDVHRNRRSVAVSASTSPVSGWYSTRSPHLRRFPVFKDRLKTWHFHKQTTYIRRLRGQPFVTRQISGG
jgi:hypothetical protein